MKIIVNEFTCLNRNSRFGEYIDCFYLPRKIETDDIISISTDHDTAVIQMREEEIEVKESLKDIFTLIKESE